MTLALTETQQQQYWQDGFLLVENALPQALLMQLQAVTQELIEASRECSENNDVYDLDDGHSPTSPRLNRIKTPHLVNDVYWQSIRSGVMLAYLKPLLGENIRLHNSKLNTKAAQGGAPVHWHQDWAFYPHTNDDLLAVGVMLSDIGLEDGPLQMVPGSHRRPMLSHFRDGVFCGAVDPHDSAARLHEAVTLTGKAGSISLHHARTLHGSAPNEGQTPRLLLLYEAGAADAWPLNGAQSAFTGLSQAELWQRFNNQMICGSQSVHARLADVPVMMPVPPPSDASSIFQIQNSGGAINAFG